MHHVAQLAQLRVMRGSTYDTSQARQAARRAWPGRVTSTACRGGLWLGLHRPVNESEGEFGSTSSGEGERGESPLCCPCPSASMALDGPRCFVPFDLCGCLRAVAAAACLPTSTWPPLTPALLLHPASPAKAAGQARFSTAGPPGQTEHSVELPRTRSFRIAG